MSIRVVGRTRNEDTEWGVEVRKGVRQIEYHGPYKTSAEAHVKKAELEEERRADPDRWLKGEG